MTIKFSIIIPVFNRPQEVKELLESLAAQSDKDFELIIAEDGSTDKSDSIIESYKDRLNIKYFFKPNTGPGLTRNFGLKKATGDYFIFFDSDCVIPEHYIKTVREELSQNFIDCYGGPDKAQSTFSPMQKAINYSMTSFITTGGIRGGKKKMDKFYPRSFNMGFSKAVFLITKGYSEMRFGEDIDFSLRVIENGFKTRLIENAFVYHKRRTSFRKFFKQVFNSGIARINLYKRHPQSLKVVHLLPACFVIFTFLLICLSFLNILFIFPLLFLIIIIFFDSVIQNKNIEVAFLSVAASFIQLSGYGTGFLLAVYKRLILQESEFQAYKKNFYK